MFLLLRIPSQFSKSRKKVFIFPKRGYKSKLPSYVSNLKFVSQLTMRQTCARSGCKSMG